MYDSMNLDATFLLACLWIPSHPLEYKVGEQGICCGIDNPQTSYTLLCSVASAVRGKIGLVCLVKVMIDILKKLFRPSGVGIGQSTSLGDCPDAYMMQFTHFCCHRGLYFTQRIETHNNCI